MDHPDFKYFQDGPSLRNQYLQDQALNDTIKMHIPQDVLKQFNDDLINFGSKTSTQYIPYHFKADQSPPKLQKYSASGEQINTIHFPESWKFFKSQSAKQNLVSLPYKNKYKQYSRLYQLIKMHLFAPSCGLFSCPLGMTDGAAFVLNKYLHTTRREDPHRQYIQSVLNHLISQNPEQFWTSGQWMTQKRGGSDVSQSTQTTAIIQTQSKLEYYSITGYKWFTSAIDSQIALCLAKIKDSNNNIDKTPTLFLVNTRSKAIEIVRLKDKLGTRQVPTAQLKLHSLNNAIRISPRGKGIAYIADMVNITRIHNSISAVSYMRRIISLAKDYASKRNIHGVLLNQLPLQNRVIGELEIIYRGCLAFLFEVTRLLGLVQNNLATQDQETMLRFMTPILKVYTAKSCMKVVSEGLELFGGLGYLQDSHLPLILRDAQVLSIWQGTSNVMCMDMLRAMKNNKRSHIVTLNMIRGSVSNLAIMGGDKTERAVHEVVHYANQGFEIWTQVLKALKANQAMLFSLSRILCFWMADLIICALFANMAETQLFDRDGSKNLIKIFIQWGMKIKQDFQVVKTSDRLINEAQLLETLGKQRIVSDSKNETDYMTGRVKPKL